MSDVLAAAALLLSLGSLTLTVLVMRQSAHTTAVVRRHRLAHTAVEHSPDPMPEPGTVGDGGRGAHRREPVTGTFPAIVVTTDEPLTRERAEQIRRDADTAEQPAARPGPPR